MGRYKLGPNGAYYDQNDVGPDQASPEQIAALQPMPKQQAPAPMQQMTPMNQEAPTGTLQTLSGPDWSQIQGVASPQQHGAMGGFIADLLRRRNPTMFDGIGAGSDPQGGIIRQHLDGLGGAVRPDARNARNPFMGTLSALSRWF